MLSIEFINLLVCALYRCHPHIIIISDFYNVYELFLSLVCVLFYDYSVVNVLLLGDSCIMLYKKERKINNKLFIDRIMIINIIKNT